MSKLVIISTHPIQYYAPLYRMLTERNNILLKVFYTWSQAQKSVEDSGFGKEIKWDIPLLEGYQYEFVENAAKKPGNRSFFGIDNPELIEKINSYQPDAVLVYGWNFKSHLKVMRYFKGKIPVWFRGDSHLLDEKGDIKTFIRRIFLKQIYKYVDRAFYVGTNNKQYFLRHGLRESQLIFAPHAVENERFFDDEVNQYRSRASEWRVELGFSPDDLVVLFTGKFEPKKNPVLLLKAVQHINLLRRQKDILKQVKLLFVGNGILEDELKKLTEGDTNIQFLPFQNQSIMPVVYRLGDIFCLPSQGPAETWGLAVNEAMASGKPVIVSDKVGCAVDLVREEKNGFIFKSGSQEELELSLQKVKRVDLLSMEKFTTDSIIDWSYDRICECLEAILLNG